MATKSKRVAGNEQRNEIRAILEQRYAPNYHHIMIHQIIADFGTDIVVVLLNVETSAYYHRRVAVITAGLITNDMIAEQV
jgi:hypothetical protein